MMKNLILWTLLQSVFLIYAAVPKYEWFNEDHVFLPHHNYIYEVVSQTRTDVGTKKITQRYFFEATIHFKNPSEGILKLTNIKFGSRNDFVKDPNRFKKSWTFQMIEIDDDLYQQLILPCEFKVSNGLMEKLYFNVYDSPWSMNAKRTVLNLFSIRNLNDRFYSDEDSSDQREFIIREGTLDGDCWNSYVIKRASTIMEVKKIIDFQTCETNTLPLNQFLSFAEDPSMLNLNHCKNRSSEFFYHLHRNEQTYGVENVQFNSKVTCDVLPDFNTTMNATTIMESVLRYVYRTTPRKINVVAKSSSLLYSSNRSENIDVINGNPVTEGYHHVVQLIYDDQERTKKLINLCTGSIVGKYIILFAAHCLDKTERKKENYAVLVGRYESREGFPYIPRDIKIMPGYISGEYGKDVALVYLKEDIDFLSTKYPAKIISIIKSQSKLTGNCAMAGFGYSAVDLPSTIFVKHILRQ